MFDVLGRITELRTERKWTVYKLSKLSGIPQSTIATWYQKNLQPPVDKLELLCETFEISLSDFFSIGDKKQLTGQQLLILTKWGILTPSKRQAVLEILDLLIQED
ncbi:MULTISPECIES: helix-turn-helix domain-containing protein [Clostridia]|uniref:helix-turn-helix domain-containing protein n=1 Tax=Clostridia TaxID=186801 RepID=UPI0006D0F16F|nr:helix-turn-helix transcriptional regulator [Lacrimispora amygdalina]